MNTDSVSVDWVEALILVAGAWPEMIRVARDVPIVCDVSLRQTAQVQRFGGSGPDVERKAIVTANIEHFPGAECYPKWEQRARIERIEALTCALLSAIDWIAFARNNISNGKSIGTMDMLKAARTIGVCEDPNVQRTSERMRCAGYYRSTVADDEQPAAYPLDAFEDRPTCMVCHYPIGSWEPEPAATVGIHESCVHYLRKHGVANVE